MIAVRRLLAELRRRKVLRTTLFYAASAWVVIQVVTTLLPVFNSPPLVTQVVVGLIIAGLPAAIIVSWLFDLTPSGFIRDERDAPDADMDTATTAVATTGGDRAPVVWRPAPAQPTRLLGRDEDVARVCSLLREHARVVTITGPGGTGKTRLGIAAAERARDGFPDGFAYIELAATCASEDVVPEIAAALGVQEAGTRTLADGVVTVVGDRCVLLILDNLEQVIDAAPDLAALVARCASLRLLCTSRAPLRIAAEVEFPLRPLALPPPGETPAPEDLEMYPAVELFLERTRRVRPDFRLTPDRADAVLQICRRLDGLPLALELAAARLRTLEPDELLQRLTRALDVLTAGARDLPERQRTLRATIDWSHSLLSDPERRLFRRLAVFAGGWTLDAAAAVCDDVTADLPGDASAPVSATTHGSADTQGNGDRPGAAAPGVDVVDARWLDLHASLVEKGLVQHAEDGRFRMLETIREYGLERLAESGEERHLRDRHAAYYAAFTRQMYGMFRGPGQLESLRRTEAEATNLDEAMAHLHATGLAGDADATAAGLAMCGGLWMYWHVRGLHLRAQSWSDRMLTLPLAHSCPDESGCALTSAAIASMTLGDIDGAQSRSSQAASLLGGGSDMGIIATMGLGVCHLTAGRLDRARPYLEEAARRAAELERPWERGLGLAFLGHLELASGRLDEARAAFDDSIALTRGLGDHEALGIALSGLAALEGAAGRQERALELYREALDVHRACGDRPEEARILDALAWTFLGLQRHDDARAHFAASVRAYQDVGSARGVGIALLGLASVEAAAGRPDRALRIAAAAGVLAGQEGVVIEYASATAAPQYLQGARDALDPATVAQLETEGRALSARDAVHYALQQPPTPVPRSVEAVSLLPTPV